MERPQKGKSGVPLNDTLLNFRLWGHVRYHIRYNMADFSHLKFIGYQKRVKQETDNRNKKIHFMLSHEKLIRSSNLAKKLTFVVTFRNKW